MNQETAIAAADTDSFRVMHMMVRVGDLKRSTEFYCGLLGMKELKRVDVPQASYTNVFVGYGSELTHPVIELTYNYGVERYEAGDGFGHLAIGVRDLYGVCARLEAAGVPIPRAPGPLKFGTVHIAFVEDPDGYKIELIDLGTGDYAQTAAG